MGLMWSAAGWQQHEQRSWWMLARTGTRWGNSNASISLKMCSYCQGHASWLAVLQWQWLINFACFRIARLAVECCGMRPDARRRWMDGSMTQKIWVMCAQVVCVSCSVAAVRRSSRCCAGSAETHPSLSLFCLVLYSSIFCVCLAPSQPVAAKVVLC